MVQEQHKQQEVNGMSLTAQSESRERERERGIAIDGITHRRKVHMYISIASITQCTSWKTKERSLHASVLPG